MTRIFAVVVLVVAHGWGFAPACLAADPTHLLVRDSHRRPSRAIPVDELGDFLGRPVAYKPGIRVVVNRSEHHKVPRRVARAHTIGEPLAHEKPIDVGFLRHMGQLADIAKMLSGLIAGVGKRRV